MLRLLTCQTICVVLLYSSIIYHGLKVPYAYAQDDAAISNDDAKSSGMTPNETIDKKFIPEGGAGDLLIAPTRVIFSGRERSAEVILKNRGSSITTYRIELMDLEVNDSGEYEPTEHYEKSAVSMIRYSPRQVTIEPGASQKIKLLARKPANLAEGEYRAHLKFQALPDGDASKDVEALSANDKVSIKLTPIIGISIPVILQQGTLSADVSMQAKRVGDIAEITIKRSGKGSAIGDIIIRAEGTIISSTSASVLYPATHRKINIALPASAKGKALTIEFVEPQSDPVKILANSAI